MVERLPEVKQVLAYPYRRSVGPVLGRFFGSLSEQRLEGIKGTDGRVLVPPLEYDPVTGEALSEFVFDLRQPNMNYLSASPTPLIQRNPLLFWKGLCFILACVVLFLIARQHGAH